MRILFDPPAVALLAPMLTRPAPENRPPYRCYAAGAPFQTTLELGNCLALEWLVNAVVEAQCTYAFGEPGFVLPGNQGRLHRHITVLGLIDEPADIALGQLITTGPRAETDAAAIRTPAPDIDLARWTAQRQMGGHA